MKNLGTEITEVSEVLKPVLLLYPSVELKKGMAPRLPVLPRFMSREEEEDCLAGYSLHRFHSDQSNTCFKNVFLMISIPFIIYLIHLIYKYFFLMELSNPKVSFDSTWVTRVKSYLKLF